MKIKTTYTTTDVHVAGEAYRIMKEAPLGYYQSLQEVNEQFPIIYEQEMKLLLNEPRGFAGLNGCLVVPPFKSGVDAAVVFFNHTGTVPMQYGGIVAVITALLESGQLKAKPSAEYNIETVSGVVTVWATIKDDEVKVVSLKSGPCKVVKNHVPISYLDLQTEVTFVQADHLYAIFDKVGLPFDMEIENLPEINQWGKKVIEALGEESHDFNRIILLDHSQLSSGRIKTVTFRPDRYIVRSPGFGTLAACGSYLLENGDIYSGRQIENEGIFNARLAGELFKKNECDYSFSFSARGFITGIQTYVLDPTDPLSEGFLLK
ncbi:proline racemase family protein [Oceanobacillus sp. FSL K6-0127]|uniref:proline racemase family protein n=1 Tax=Oceanobacillus sp. FSL K6-0127 TaxID=2921420 RepID=UPI0030EDC3F4|nr:proline racemase family protein [Oceanobacillus sp.]MBR3197932.1 proline racemase family protein [Methanobrevibacter sp.]